MENYAGYVPRQNTHSNMARVIVNGLIIAKLHKNAETFLATIKDKNEINPQTKTITFHSRNDIPVKGLKRYYRNI